MLSQDLPSVEVQESSGDIETNNWFATIETLLGPDHDYTLKVTDDALILGTETAEQALAIQQVLQNTLKSSQAFWRRLPYSLRHEGSIDQLQSAEEESVVPPMPSCNTVEEGIRLLTKLFSKEHFEDISIDPKSLFDSAKGASSREGVLYSKPAIGKVKAELLEKIVPSLLLAFKNVDVQTLRKIWTDSESHLPTMDPEEAQDDVVSFQGLAQQCFGVLADGDGSAKKSRLYFNYGLLYRFIFPPKMESVQMQEEDFAHSIVIPKKHLLSYMQQLVQGGTLLSIARVNTPGQEASFVARPVFFVDEQAINKSHHYTVIIDKSGSMEEHLPSLITHVKAFMQRIKLFDEGAQLKIVFFNGGVGAEDVRTFAIHQSDEITAFMDQVQASGATRLYGTVADELDSLLAHRIPESFISTVVLFTDGKDEQPDVPADARVTQQSVIQKIEAFKAAGLIPPKLFTMGFGEHYNHEALDAFSQATGMPFIHLSSLEDFEQVYSYLHLIQYERQALAFVTSVNGYETQYDLSLVRDGNPSLSSILTRFRLGDSVQIQGRPLVLRNVEVIPEFSIEQKIEATWINIYWLVAFGTETWSAKIEACKGLGQEILRLQQNLSGAPSVGTHVKIKDYLERLEKATTTQAQQGIQSDARSRLAYEKTEREPVQAVQPTQSSSPPITTAYDRSVSASHEPMVVQRRPSLNRTRSPSPT